jgi:hypothetical protein
MLHRRDMVMGKVISLVDRGIPKNTSIRGLLHIAMSLVIAYMSFFVGTALAILLISCAVLSSVYGQWLISRDDNKLSE